MREVRQAVVVVRNNAAGLQRLVAYVVPEKGRALDPKAARQALQAQLPEYMIPSAFVSLDKLPLTPNNKIDRKALPEPKTVSPKAAAPRTALEAQILSVWKQLLELDDIGIHDNFFEIGGHSLLALRLFAQLEPVLGKLPVGLIFEAPTVAQMTAKLSEDGFRPRWRSLVGIRPNGSKPPLFVIPGAQGNALHSTRLAWELGPEQPVYALHSVGLDGQRAPLEHVEEIAKYFLDEIRPVQEHGPYYLAGICMGGVVAWEMARQLRAQGEEVALLAMVETWMPDSLKPLGLRRFAASRPLFFLTRRIRQHAVALEELDRRQKLRYVMRLVKLLGQTILREEPQNSFHSDMVQQVVVQTNNVAMSRYKPRPYDGSTMIVLADAGGADPGTDPRLGWTALAGGGSEVYKLKGPNADALMREPMVSALASHLKEGLAAAQMVKVRQP